MEKSISQESFEYNGRIFPKYEVEEVEGEEFVVPSKMWIKYKELNLLKLKIELSGIGFLGDYSFESYKGTNSSSNIDKLKQYVSRFKEKYCHVHLYFWSLSNGTQKSTIAKIVGTELLKKGLNVKFILMSTLLDTLTENKFSEDAKKAIEEWKECDFLIVDDAFDPKKATVYKSGYQFSFLDSFLRERLEVTRKAVCFTSNIPIDNIENSWTTSIGKLVKRSVPDPFEFKDHINDFNIKDLWS